MEKQKKKYGANMVVGNKHIDRLSTQNWPSIPSSSMQTIPRIPIHHRCMLLSIFSDYIPPLAHNYFIVCLKH